MNPNHLPNSGQDCDDVLDLIADYAFGLTDGDETRRVEAKLADCQDAAARLAEYRLLQDEMRADVPQIEPPAQLGARLMAAVSAVEPPASRPRRPIPLAWLAAAAAVVALVLTNAYWLTRVDHLLQEQQEYGLLETDGGGGPFVLTSTSDLRWVRLPDAQQNGKASAFLMWNAESEIGLLYVQGFPNLPDGKIYQLWLTRGEERASVGTFMVDPNGKSALLFHSSEPIDKYTWSRITVEPENGSPQPSDNIVVVGQL